MEHHVGSDGYADLTTALAHAVAGDVVVLDPSYLPSEGVVLVDVAVTIRSGSGTSAAPPLLVEASGPVRLEGLWFAETDGFASPCGVSAALFDADALGDGPALCVLGGDVAVSGSTFDGSSGTGAVVVGGKLTLARTCFTGWTRGALWSLGSSVEVTDSSFLSSTALSGAGIFAFGSDLIVRGTTFHGLRASRDGGALAVVDTYTEVVDSVFDDVSAEGDGGAVWASGSEPFDVVVASTSFVGGESPAARRGGAIALEGGRLLATGVSFSDLVAVEGGAVFAARSMVDASRVVLCDNAAERGGAMVLTDTSLSLRNGRSIGNHASRGASLLATGTGLLEVAQSTFVDDVGDAVLDVGGAVLAVRGSIFASSSPALRLGAGALASGDHDLWWNGPVGVGETLGLALPSATDVIGDPRFADYDGAADCDAGLWLMPDSPAVDAGDPEQQDPDGTAADIGAYGGPDAVLPDLDRDGTTWGLDCDDSDPDVHPGAPDAPLDGLDQDCDGVDACDRDGDGVCAPLDCDDAAADVSPGGVERPYDGIDQDCSGGDACDLDGDGALDPRCGGEDCDDSDPEPCPGVGRFAGGCSSAPIPRGVVFALLVGLTLRRRGRRSERSL